MDETTSLSRQVRPPSTSEERPWRGWWLVGGLALACLPVSAGALLVAAFGGRSEWFEYLWAGLFWAVPLCLLSVIPDSLGRASRRLALALAATGIGYLLLELPSFLRDPGWQF